VRVHFLSPHPFVLGEWTRLGAGDGLSTEAVKLADPPRAPLLEAGAVGVLDACFALAVLAQLVADIFEAQPAIRLVVVMEELSEAAAFPLLRQGVKGLLTYADGPRTLRSAIAAVARGGMWAPRALLSAFLESLLRGTGAPVALAVEEGLISPRESEVLAALLQNLSNKEIAARLNISERTVKFHVSNLLAKFAVARRSDLILRTRQARLGQGRAQA
jgi:DNA-binding NarL/FixJ family response regulator